MQYVNVYTLSVPEAPSADPEHPQGFPLSVPWVSAEFWQGSDRFLAALRQNFGTKKPRPRCITAGGGEAHPKLLCLS